MKKIIHLWTIVLNLVISGIPSILGALLNSTSDDQLLCFKPCYKWNTFNTVHEHAKVRFKDKEF